MIRLVWLDYRATLRERRTWIAAGALAYAVLTLPLLTSRPPPHVQAAMTLWFGAPDPFTLFMFIWTDLAMNKMIALLGVVLGAGVVLRERDTRVLALLAAKPVPLPRYFAVRAASACATAATLYLAAQLAAVPYFMVQVEGFRPGAFLAAGALHVWAGVFATALCATLAALVGRRGPGMLLALLVVMLLVGAAFLGFYNPAWRTASLVNPISLGVQALGHLDALGPAVLLPPMLALALLTAATVAVGARAVRGMEV